MNTHRWFHIAFFFCVGLIAYYDFTLCGDLPWPPRLWQTGIVFLLLQVFSGFNDELAGVMAIAFVLAFWFKRAFISDCTHAEGTAQTTGIYTMAGISSGANYTPQAPVQSSTPAQTPAPTNNKQSNVQNIQNATQPPAGFKPIKGGVQ